MGLYISETPQGSNPYLKRLQVVRGSIIEQNVDAIVTLIPQTLEYRGAINQLIQKAAGEKIDVFIQENVVHPRAGDVYAVPGFDLPCKHIFFCVVPVWRDEWDRHNSQLLNASRKAMELASRMSLKTIAFPPIGSGSHGFPKARAVRLIVQGITDRLDKKFEQVQIVCQKAETQQLFEERLRAESLRL